VLGGSFWTWGALLRLQIDLSERLLISLCSGESGDLGLRTLLGFSRRQNWGVPVSHPILSASFHIPPNMGKTSNALSGSKPHSAAKAETTGYARACRRAFDSQPRGRSQSAVWCPARRRRALDARFRQ
jgi:hypothetical protein